MAGVVRLSRNVHQSLGEEVAGELERGFDQVEAVSRAAHRELIDLIVDRRITEAVAGLRADLCGEIKDLEVRLRQDMGGLRGEIAELRGEVRGGRAETESRMLKWMFLFWIVMIGTIFLRP